MTSDKAVETLARIALHEVGTREVGGNNLGPRVKEYQSATWLEPGPWPWCAAFVCWCIRIWLNTPGVSICVGCKGKEEGWRPKTAGAFDFVRWAHSKDLPVYNEDVNVKQGDLIVFDFSHIGIVAVDAPSSYSVIATIEGNTNGRGSRESESGDGVWTKQRARSLAHYFIRLIP
jgi:hypothetical protein